MTTTAKKTFLITGVSSGLGKAFAEGALAAGHTVIGTVRSGDAAANFRALADRAHPLVLDVTDFDAIPATVAKAEADIGPIDVLVNNAGYGNVGSVEDTSLTAFRKQIETNLFGTIIMTKAVIPHMRERRSGHIVQFSSVGGRLGAPACPVALP